VREIARQLDTCIRLIPMSFAVWTALARVAEFLLAAPLTRNQIDLMRHDNVAAVDLPGLKELDIEPRSIGAVIRMIEQARHSHVTQPRTGHSPKLRRHRRHEDHQHADRHRH